MEKLYKIMKTKEPCNCCDAGCNCNCSCCNCSCC